MVEYYSTYLYLGFKGTDWVITPISPHGWYEGSYHTGDIVPMASALEPAASLCGGSRTCPAGSFAWCMRKQVRFYRLLHLDHLWVSCNIGVAHTAQGHDRHIVDLPCTCIFGQFRKFIVMCTCVSENDAVSRCVYESYCTHKAYRYRSMDVVCCTCLCVSLPYVFYVCVVNIWCSAKV